MLTLLAIAGTMFFTGIIGMAIILVIQDSGHDTMLNILISIAFFASLIGVMYAIWKEESK